MKSIDIRTPLGDGDVRALRSGDAVSIRGTIYTARDAAHRRLIEALDAGRELPLPLAGQIIYYAGPAPSRPGQIVGPVGPTTSYRMDAYTLPLLARGLKGMIGKGHRSEDVVTGMVEHGAVYFGAIGGAAALIARCVRSCEIVAYEDLGAEAIHALTVEAFPAIVIIDAQGNDLYRTERAKYARP